MIRRALRLSLGLLLLAAATAAAAPAVTSINPPPSGGPSLIVPGLSYQRVVTSGQVTHVIRMRPGPLLGLQPILTGGGPTVRATLTSAMRAQRAAGAVAGVNADYFNLDQGFPSGLLVSGGELVKEPEASRSALAIGAGSSLAVARMVLAASWRPTCPEGSPPPTPRFIQGINRPSQRSTRPCSTRRASGQHAQRRAHRGGHLDRRRGGARRGRDPHRHGGGHQHQGRLADPNGRVVLTGVGSRRPRTSRPW